MRRVILLVEDEAAIAEVVELYLVEGGFSVRWVTKMAEARRQLGDPSIALILLDLTLPDGDGIEFFREIRLRSDVPVIMVTARGQEADRVLGLELGADDYIPKPFSPRELVARVRSVLRRNERGPDAQGSGPISIGRLTVDPVGRTARINDRDVDLTRKELDLLMHLLSNHGRVFNRAQLMEAVWGYPQGGDSRTVDVHVAQLRRKLGSDCPVRTVRGVGYKAEAL